MQLLPKDIDGEGRPGEASSEAARQHSCIAPVAWPAYPYLSHRVYDLDGNSAGSLEPNAGDGLNRARSHDRAVRCGSFEPSVQPLRFATDFGSSSARTPNFASRSKMRYWLSVRSGNASRSCCTIHSLVG